MFRTPETLPTISRLHDLLAYDAETGALVWRVHRRPNLKPGDEAGWTNRKGRVIVGIDGRIYTAAQVIWAMQTRRWPVSSNVYFKDGNPQNLCWDNLTTTRRARSRTPGAEYIRALRATNKKAMHVIAYDAELRNLVTNGDDADRRRAMAQARQIVREYEEGEAAHPAFNIPMSKSIRL